MLIETVNHALSPETMTWVVVQIDNPLNDITPNFNAFGVEFNALWKKLLGAIWALAIIAAVFYLIRGIVASNSHQGGGHPSQVREARAEAQRAAIALGALAALPAIVGAILFVAG